MKYACDLDVFRGWGSAVTNGRLGAALSRLYNVANIYQRARGSGRIARIEGAELHRYAK